MVAMVETQLCVANLNSKLVIQVEGRRSLHHKTGKCLTFFHVFVIFFNPESALKAAPSHEEEKVVAVSALEIKTESESKGQRTGQACLITTPIDPAPQERREGQSIVDEEEVEVPDFVFEMRMIMILFLLTVVIAMISVLKFLIVIIFQH